MLKPLPQHRASPTSSPIFHYAPTSHSVPSSPLSRRHSKSRGSVTYRTPPQRAQAQYVDAATQWSPIMNSKAEDSVEQQVEQPQSAKVEPQEEDASPSGVPPSVPPSPPKPALQPESPGLKRRQSQGTASSIPTATPTIHTKRPRSDQEPKVLPLKYEFCAVEDMVILIANMIQELIQTNDRLPLRSGVLTRFHSR